ncbi:hypothetical protein PROFUN_15182 [Planoprotostelium fungivorum]|uniref:Uncharacterized protein n=1 Tax=Planoprotostelium fungivorum TaxID=1890364 RepID=A0A2P6MVZ0_9EUKA|nr:hypothetical protein PROFUN_15182 [Planoprotostelium fungivorum]
MSKVKNEGRSRYTRGQNTKEAVAYCNLNKDENRKLNGKRLLARNGCLNAQEISRQRDAAFWIETILSASSEHMKDPRTFMFYSSSILYLYPVLLCSLCSFLCTYCQSPSPCYLKRPGGSACSHLEPPWRSISDRVERVDYEYRGCRHDECCLFKAP